MAHAFNPSPREDEAGELSPVPCQSGLQLEILSFSKHGDVVGSEKEMDQQGKMPGTQAWSLILESIENVGCGRICDPAARWEVQA